MQEKKVAANFLKDIRISSCSNVLCDW